MSRFYPHPPYAEDQPLKHTILTVHVLARGFQTGALIGALYGASIPLTQRILSRPQALPASLSSTIIRSAGVGSVVGTGLLGLALVGRMYKRSEIEWADRSWRLLENKGQVEVDDWSLGGAILGAGVVSLRTEAGKLGWRTALGGVGLGSMAGVGGYMVWRHGIKGGKWEEDEKNLKEKA